MKKTLSVILSLVLVFAFVPFCFAEDATEVTEDTVLAAADADFFNVNGTTVIKSGATLEIGEGVDAVIAEGKSVELEAGAVLSVIGTLEVARGGVLTVKGVVVHSERVTVLGTALVEFTFPNLRSTALGSHLDSVVAGYSNDGSTYADVSNNVTWSGNLVNGGSFSAPLNSVVYIKTQFSQPAVPGVEAPVTYDDSKLAVYSDGELIPCVQGVHMFTATAASEISYGEWDDSAYLYGYSFYVPSGAGYTVHSVTGETSSFGAIKVKAGSDFRFRIEIDGKYDMSAYEIYVYEGYTYDQETGGSHADNDATLMQADTDGYYTVPNVYSDYTIFVQGVVSNEAIERTSSILDMLKNVFKVFQTIFQKLAAIFGFSIGA